MKSRTTKVTVILDRVFGVLAFGSGVVIIFVTLSVSSEVVTRYFLKTPIEGVVDFAEISILWVAFLTAPWLEIDKHMRMDVVIKRLRPRPQFFLGVITSIIGAAICLALTFYGSWVTWDVFAQNVRELGVLEIPTSIVVSVIPIGYFLLFFQFLRKAYRDWAKLNS